MNIESLILILALAAGSHSYGSRAEVVQWRCPTMAKLEPLSTVQEIFCGPRALAAHSQLTITLGNRGALAALENMDAECYQVRLAELSTTMERDFRAFMSRADRVRGVQTFRRWLSAHLSLQDPVRICETARIVPGTIEGWVYHFQWFVDDRRKRYVLLDFTRSW